MARTSPWWRKVGMALAALVMTVLTFGPSLDSIVCQDERGLSAAAAEQPMTQAGPDVDVAGHDNEGLGACAHGHCHHGGAYVSVAPVAAETRHDLTGAAHALPRERVPTSDPKFGLMRPPRA
jgi:hypothetical protein